MFHRFFDRTASAILRSHKWILIAWVVLVAIAFPFAGKLKQGISSMQANRWIAGTDSKATYEFFRAKFPEAASDRRTVVVLKTENVLSDEMKHVYKRFEQEFSAHKDGGGLTAYITPLEIYRSVAAQYAREAHQQLLPALDQARAALKGTPLNESALKDMVVAQTKQRQGLSEGQAWVLRQVADLPATPSDADIRGLAEKVVDRYSLTAFPIEVPGDVVEQLISADKQVAMVSASFVDEGAYQPQLDLLRDVAAKVAKGYSGPALEYHATSEKALGRDMTKIAEDDNGKMELAAIGMAVLVLLIFFRSPVATGLTLVLIQLSTFVSKALLYFMVRAGVELSPFTMPMMTFVMLGAGVDYSMILSERYQQERAAGRSKREALQIALSRSGESVFFSGVTVLIAFGATTLSQVGFIKGLGYGGIAAILTVLVAALTLTPAILMLIGDAFFWPAKLTGTTKESPITKYLNASVRFTARNPLLITLLFVLILIPSGLILRNYNPMAHPVVLSPESDSKAGFAIVADKWGEAWLMPTTIAVSLDASQVSGAALTPDAMSSLKDLVRRLEAVPGVQRVSALSQPFGKPLSDADLARIPPVIQGQFFTAENLGLRISVMLTDEPVSQEANATADRIRQAVKDSQWTGATMTVGGSTLADREYRDALMKDFWRMVSLITVGIFIVLALQLRSVLIPVRLLFTILLGNVMAIAFLVVVFQWIRQIPVTTEVPILLVVLMMGLGLDYEIFMVTRVKELIQQGYDDRMAVEEAVIKTGRVINFAGLLMAGTLGSMMLSSTMTLQAYGAALGFAVLLDATVLRTYLVPATMILLNKANWWFPFGQAALDGGHTAGAE